MTTTSDKIYLLLVLAMIGAISFVLLPPTLALTSCALGTVMLAIAIYDYRNFIIPDLLSLPAIPLGLLASLFVMEGEYAPEAALHHAAAALGCGLLLWGVRKAYQIYRKREGLGLGDVKLGFACGAWTGFPGFAHVLALAAIVAILHTLLSNMRNFDALSGSTRVPFGAYFAPAIWIVWLAKTAGIADFSF